MTERVPESDEVLREALADPTLEGWNENSNDSRFPGITYWWCKVADVYLGVLPGDDGTYHWFVGIGEDGDADKNTMMLKNSYERTPEKAREAATMWYNRNRNNLPRR